MWNGTVRALPLKEQLRAAAIARCEALSVMPSHYAAWLGSDLSSRDVEARADDARIGITHLDPFVHWGDQSHLPDEDCPMNAIAFAADDFFGTADALGLGSFTTWARFPASHCKTQSSECSV